MDWNAALDKKDADKHADVPALTTEDRCDARCQARALVRVLIGSKPLDFCGHHYREHEAALAAFGATIYQQITLEGQ